MLDFTVGRGRASFGIQSTRRANRGSGAVLITAINTPSGQMFEGDAAEDLPLFSDYEIAVNYSSTGGNILPPDYQLNSSTALGSTLTAEGDVPRWLISDDGGNSKAFNLPVVQYLLNILNVGINQAEIDVNPIAPGNKNLGNIVIPSGPFAATYTDVIASDLRDGPYNFGASNDVGLPSISGTIGDGETLTFSDGFWHTPPGTTLTLIRNLYADEALIEADMGSTLLLDTPTFESLQGTTVTLRVEGSDGTTTVEAISEGIVVPPATPAITVTQLGTTKINFSINAIPDSGTFACGDPAAGKKLIIQWVYGLQLGNVGDNTLDVTAGGGTALIDAEHQHENNKFTITQFAVIDASGGGDIDVSAVPNNGENWVSYARRAYLVTGGSSFDFVFDDSTSAGAMDLSAAVVDGGYVIGGSKTSNASSTANTLVGLDLDSSHTFGGGTQPAWLFSAEPDATETRSMSIVHDDSAAFNTASALVIS